MPVILGGNTSIYLASLTPPVTPFVNEYSMSFDGVDEYAKGSSTFSELDGQTKATWSYWVKPTLGSTMVLSRVSNSTSTSDFVYMHFITSTGQLYASIGDTTRYSTAASNLLSNNTWSHVLICYNGTLANGSKTKIFINGVDSTSLDTTTATSLVSANYPLSVGRRDQTPTYYYNGFMDEVALWVGSDERANVADIYNSGVPSDLSQLTTPPSHWWRMGDGDSWDGSKWTLNDNIGSYNLESVNMEEGDRVTDVPGGVTPFVNEYSMSFDGVDEYIDLGTASNLEITDDFSISVWIKDSSALNRGIICCGDRSSTSGWMIYRNSSNKAVFSLYTVNNKNATSTTSINTGTWTNIIATFEKNGTASQQLKIYINGVLEGQGGWLSTQTPTYAGTIYKQIAFPYVGTNDFEGLIDEASIYNRLLTSQEISEISAIPIDLSSYSPLSWWRMGDGDTWNGSIWTLTDNGSGGNDAISVNMEEGDRTTDKP